MLRLWNLADGRALVYQTVSRRCIEGPCPKDALKPDYYAYVFDGAKKLLFVSTSGKLKLQDGRIASVGTDGYLRIIDSSSIAYTETHYVTKY